METVRVGVVIPAFNEALHLPRVLDVVSGVDWLTQIVVVDDGSTDDTLAVAQRYALQDRRISVIHLPHNRGKADAMLAGVQALRADVVIFLDADLIGLQPHHLRQLYEAFTAGHCDMTVAIFRRGRLHTDFAHWLTPWLSGQRCLRRSAAEQALRSLQGSRYGVETGLTLYARRHGWRYRYVAWEGLTHVVQEQKHGTLLGLCGHARMYIQIAMMLLALGGSIVRSRLVFSLHLSPLSYQRLAIVVTVLLVLTLWLGGYDRLQARTELRLRDLATLEVERYHRILIFAPHPDDEVLASGGVIATALALEPAPEVRVVVVTNGEASLSTALANGYNPISQHSVQRLAEARRQESLRALTALGLYPEQVQFWGFPDGGLEPIWQRYWTGEASYRSRWTGLTSSEQAVNSPVVPYTGAALLGLLRKALAEFQPDAVVMPHPRDAHPDHRALAYFISVAISLNQAEGLFPAPDLFAYVIWLNMSPRPVSIRLDRNPLRLPARFNEDAAQWVRLPLTATVREHKAIAIQAYRTQARVLPSLLRSAVSENEVFTRQLLQHEIPQRSSPPPMPPDEMWQPFPYEEDWKWPGAYRLVAPLSLWVAADSRNVWLAAQLPSAPRKGLQYVFVVRTAHGSQPIEMRLPAREVAQARHGHFVLARVPVAELDRGEYGQVLMVSLETRLAGSLTVTRGTWRLLYLPGGYRPS
ncbi:MAG: glycosyltransferase [Anaerolineae bacterium]|nr:glycosyltransferase [Anaerolineae bacterium]MDW8098784.1 glycosyltransferase [Anaerolineae bacterium]